MKINGIEIEKVELIKDERYGDSYLLNGNIGVPMVKGNRHFDAIEKWIAEGGKVDERD